MSRFWAFPMVIFVTGIFLFEYAAIGVLLIGDLLLSGRTGLIIEGVIDLVIFNVVWILALWSYFRAVFSNPGYVNANKVNNISR
jgi:hypothetical protein